jgi:hypothetical protein
MKKVDINVSHSNDGLEEYDYNLFNHCQPILVNIINNYKEHNILPKIGEMIYVENDISDVVYFVTKICYYDNNYINFWVKEELD